MSCIYPAFEPSSPRPCFNLFFSVDLVDILVLFLVILTMKLQTVSMFHVNCKHDKTSVFVLGVFKPKKPNH